MGWGSYLKVMDFLEFWNFLEFLEKSWNFYSVVGSLSWEEMVIKQTQKWLIIIR